MEVFRSPADMHAFSRAAHRRGDTLVLVPTMVGAQAVAPRPDHSLPKLAWMLQGFLHQGHLQLVQEAK